MAKYLSYQDIKIVKFQKHYC